VKDGLNLNGQNQVKTPHQQNPPSLRKQYSMAKHISLDQVTMNRKQAFFPASLLARAAGQYNLYI
jgi:hypothetical protein